MPWFKFRTLVHGSDEREGHAEVIKLFGDRTVVFLSGLEVVTLKTQTMLTMLSLEVGIDRDFRFMMHIFLDHFSP